MSDQDKLQRRMLRDAEARRKLEQKAYQQRRRAADQAEREARARDAERLHCPRCLALYVERTKCPKCDLGRANFFKFCRNCLRVHGSLETCVAWKPAVVELKESESRPRSLRSAFESRFTVEER